MLFAKSGLELLILSVFHHDNQFVYPLTWVLVLALLFTAVLQVCSFFRLPEERENKEGDSLFFSYIVLALLSESRRPAL